MVEFTLSATGSINRHSTPNDNQYEYETLEYPFLYQLGQPIYLSELARKHSPDLERFEGTLDSLPLVQNVDKYLA